MWFHLSRLLWVTIDYIDSDGHTWGASQINNSSRDVYT